MVVKRIAALLLGLGAALALPPAVAGFLSKSEKELVTEADAFVRNKPEPLQHFFHTLYLEGEWNAVLNFNLLALAALETGRPEIAERALDQSTARILRIFADDPNAKKAKSVWAGESVKDFKGEPYERAMAFYYRGLLYVREGDFQNARASFLQADIQNAMGQTERYPQSFALPLYLAAWASFCDGDTARAEELGATANKVAVDPFFHEGAPDFPRHLTIFERGMGPEKVTLGETRSILGFLPSADLGSRVKVSYAGETLMPAQLGVAANLDWLALTRGGRPIQGILDGKAQFKQATAGMADVSGKLAAASFYGSLATLGSDRTSIARNLGMVGMGATLFGSIASMASRAANAEADTRYWASLPKAVYVEGFSSATGLQPVKFWTPAQAAPRAPLLSASHEGKCSFAFGRELSALDVSHGGVGNPSPWPAEPNEDNRDKANEALRALLRSTF